MSVCLSVCLVAACVANKDLYIGQEKLNRVLVMKTLRLLQWTITMQWTMTT